MKSAFFRRLIIFFLILGCACGPVPDVREMFETDCRSPEILSIETRNATSLTLQFNEPVTISLPDIRIIPAVKIETVASDNDSVTIFFEKPMNPGFEYCIEGRVYDTKGNSLSFLSTFYGKNENIPEILINEFTTNGSGNHPDCVELAVLSDGNIAGLALMDGINGYPCSRMVFPEMNVRKGDFIIIHFKPEGRETEIDELTDTTLAKGFDTSDTAFDFWVKGGTGLSSNNGVLVLYENPVSSKALDCVIYSTRTSGSDAKYRGFGSRVLVNAVDALSAIGAWAGIQSILTPEDAVNPEGSTGTRSICRDPESRDTNTRLDWRIVETKCSTFGSPNSTKYLPGR